jgi:hypothetical protein
LTGTGESRPGSSKRRSRARNTGAVGLLLVVALAGVGAARAPSVDQGLCIPLLMNCSTPTPTPTPTPSPSSSSTSPLGGLGGLLGGDSSSSSGSTGGTGDSSVPPLILGPDTGAPTFTQPSAQLGGSSISFSGLQQVGIVTVPIAGGGTTTAIKLAADDIVITDFVLDVRRATGPSLVSTSPRMELKGHVQVYVNSLTASLLGGGGLTLLAPTPPPGNELPPQLLRINLGLVGVTADSISFASSHQEIHE